MLTLLTGFIASIAHVVTGPDHLAAVTPLAIDSRGKSWLIGFSWGLGHTLGMVIIGVLFLLFRQVLPMEAISSHSETIIGLLLIIIGGYAVFRTWVRHSHGNVAHPHVHTQPFFFAHIHRHTHHDSHDHKHEHPGSTRQNALAAMSIGIIHGFAGFSHLFALLPSLALPTRFDSFLYLLAFATGTISAMVIFAFIMGFIAHRSAVKENHNFLRGFTYFGGILAILVGIWWIINPM